jgi:signal transduction histidine kinase
MIPQNQLELTVILETQGLLAALEQLKKEITKITHTAPIPIYLEAGKDVENLLSMEAQYAIFYIVGEAAANACRHAQADNLYLRLYQHGTNVIVEVEDDGVGFDVAKVEAHYAKREPSDSERLNLRERAALVKGKTRIQSAPGKGTKITVTIPVNDKSTTTGRAGGLDLAR